MCAPGSACGCGSAASDLGGGVAIVVAGAVAVGGVVAFLAAHLLMLALAAVALPVATLATVRYLRRYVAVVHKQALRPARRAMVVTPAIGHPRPAAYAQIAAYAAASGTPRARGVPAAPDRAIGARSAGRPVPALDPPAAAGLAMGGYHLHFHGVSAAEVAALLRRDAERALPLRRDAGRALPHGAGDPAPGRGGGEPVALRPGDAAALPAAEDRAPASARALPRRGSR